MYELDTRQHTWTVDASTEVRKAPDDDCVIGAKGCESS